MNAKQVVKLTQSIRRITTHAVSCEQVVWASDYGAKVEYKLFWFLDNQECDMRVFEHFKDLLTFVKEKWNV
jgi:hypothetical protein